MDYSDQERLLYVARVLRDAADRKYEGSSGHKPVDQELWTGLVIATGSIRAVLGLRDDEFQELIRA